MKSVVAAEGRLGRGGVCSDEVECPVWRWGVVRWSEVWVADDRGGREVGKRQ